METERSVHRWSRSLFFAAGAYGVAVLMPFYFLEPQIARASGAFAHPEYFYGFVGTALSAQVMFFIIGYDPMRFRPAMLFAVLPARRKSHGALCRLPAQ